MEIENNNNNNNNNNNDNNKRVKLEINNNNNDIYENASAEEKNLLDLIKQFEKDYPKNLMIDGSNIFPVRDKQFIFKEGNYEVNVFDYKKRAILRDRMSTTKKYYVPITLSGGDIGLFGGSDVISHNVNDFQLFNIKDKLIIYTLKANLQLFRHTAGGVLLRDGRVFIAGGSVVYQGVVNSCEIYDPRDDSFMLCNAGMKHRKIRPAVSLLPNGNPIVFGGFNGTDYLDTTEIYDVVNGVFYDGPKMLEKRHGHSATLLFTGEIIICGGMENQNSTEIYNPKKNEFRKGPSMKNGHSHHSATLLVDGTVLIYNERQENGYYGPPEIYNPTKNEFKLLK